MNLSLIHMTRMPALILSVALIMGSALPTFAETISIEPARDNTLYENSSGTVSNGQGEYLFAGRTGQGSNSIRRGLLYFDVAGNIPAGATIDGVSLALTLSRTISGPQRVGLYPVSSAWGEGASDAAGQEGTGAVAAPGDATWVYSFFDDTLWTSPGGDFVAVSSAEQSVAGLGTYTWGSTPEMIADVQSWLESPTNNYGWMLLGDESQGATAKRFNSREYPTVTSRPRLTVEFTPIPEPASLTILFIGASGLALWRIGRCRGSRRR